MAYNSYRRWGRNLLEKHSPRRKGRMARTTPGPLLLGLLGSVVECFFCEACGYEFKDSLVGSDLYFLSNIQ